MLVLLYSMSGLLGHKNALFFWKGRNSPSFVTIYIEFVFLSCISQILYNELSLHFDFVSFLLGCNIPNNIYI